MKLPCDVEMLVPWFGVIRRAQSVARSGGNAVITFRVVVDSEGKPLHWSEPEVTLIEPRASADALTLLLATLTKP